MQHLLLSVLSGTNDGSSRGHRLPNQRETQAARANTPEHRQSCRQSCSRKNTTTLVSSCRLVHTDNRRERGREREIKDGCGLRTEKRRIPRGTSRIIKRTGCSDAEQLLSPHQSGAPLAHQSRGQETRAAWRRNKNHGYLLTFQNATRPGRTPPPLPFRTGTAAARNASTSSRCGFRCGVVCAWYGGKRSDKGSNVRVGHVCEWEWLWICGCYGAAVEEYETTKTKATSQTASHERAGRTTREG